MRFSISKADFHENDYMNISDIQRFARAILLGFLASAILCVPLSCPRGSATAQEIDSPNTLHAAPAGPGDWSKVRLFGHAFRNDDYTPEQYDFIRDNFYAAADSLIYWSDDFDHEIGKPLSKATKDGYAYHRDFEHCSVDVNLETRTSSIAWKTVDSKITPAKDEL